MASSQTVVLETPSIVLFDHAQVAKQCNSMDLVIYCPPLRFSVKIAYPTVNGHRVPPEHLVAYLRRLGVHWPCFCAENEDESVSCLIHRSHEGLFGRCHYKPARCSFFSTLKGEYNSQDDAASPLQNYLLCEPDEATLLNPLTNAPYLKGYLGEQGNQLGGNYNLFYQLPEMSPLIEDADITEDADPTKRSVGVQTWSTVL
ncbi:hypothetical protein C8J57DRAFT_1254836 [Mycena rebaudengoi]|nr:hypothetical protein C8J57DRAFT_1254836 [Mycena rebaudengoi]